MYLFTLLTTPLTTSSTVCIYIGWVRARTARTGQPDTCNLHHFFDEKTQERKKGNKNKFGEMRDKRQKFVFLGSDARGFARGPNAVGPQNSNRETSRSQKAWPSYNRSVQAHVKPHAKHALTSDLSILCFGISAHLL